MRGPRQTTSSSFHSPAGRAAFASGGTSPYNAPVEVSEGPAPASSRICTSYPVFDGSVSSGSPLYAAGTRMQTPLLHPLDIRYSSRRVKSESFPS
jgi:hypothetical protein